MGYLYVKVIEAKKVAVKNSFFVNYPFIRIVIGKEKKSTNFKPGVEWWDKILTFKTVPKDEHQHIYIQARDKSIHVFGSDWLGEVNLDLDTELLLDGKVHQNWYKFGRGRKAHSRTPRGYIHLAFQYVEDPVHGKRPFSTAPVEPVLVFEEWLAANNKNWVSDSSAWFTNPSGEDPKWANDPLRKSAPTVSQSISPDGDRAAKFRTIASRSSPSIDAVNPDPVDTKKSNLKKSRPRASTFPEIRSPSMTRQVHEDDSSEDNEEFESDEEPVLGNLIDLSFDQPKERSVGHQKRRSSHKVAKEVSHNETPVAPVIEEVSPLGEAATIEDQIDYIKKLNLESTHSNNNSNSTQKINQEPTFGEWYKIKDSNIKVPEGINPENPFLSLHDSFAPSTSRGV